MRKSSKEPDGDEYFQKESKMYSSAKTCLSADSETMKCIQIWNMLTFVVKPSGISSKKRKPANTIHMSRKYDFAKTNLNEKAQGTHLKMSMSTTSKKKTVTDNANQQKCTPKQWIKTSEPAHEHHMFRF